MKESNSSFDSVKILMSHSKYEAALILLDQERYTELPFLKKFFQAECLLNLRQYKKSFDYFQEVMMMIALTDPTLVPEIPIKLAFTSFCLKDWETCIKYCDLSMQILANHNDIGGCRADHTATVINREASGYLLKSISFHKLGKETEAKEALILLYAQFQNKHFVFCHPLNSIFYESLIVMADICIIEGNSNHAFDYLAKALIFDIGHPSCVISFFDQTYDEVYAKYSLNVEHKAAGEEGASGD